MARIWLNLTGYTSSAPSSTDESPGFHLAKFAPPNGQFRLADRNNSQPRGATLQLRLKYSQIEARARERELDYHFESIRLAESHARSVGMIRKQMIGSISLDRNFELQLCVLLLTNVRETTTTHDDKPTTH